MKTLIFIEAGFAVAKMAAGDVEAKWCQLFPMGVVKHRSDFPGGKLPLDRAFLSAMVANWEAEGKPERAVNYFHRGASGPDITPISEKVAAGWIRNLDLRDDGLWAQIAWTDKARAFILADELRYLSPEFSPNAHSKKTGKPQGPTLFGAALLNDPYLTELPRVAASEQSNQAEPSADTGARMNKKLICAALGLSEDTADEVVMAKLAEMKAAGEKLALAEKDAAEKLALSEKTAATKLGEVTALQETTLKLTERVGTLEKENATLLSERKAGAVKSFLDGLVKAGKVTPATREGYEAIALSSGLEAIKFLEKSAAVVPMGERGVESASTTSLADAQRRIDARVAELRKADPVLKFSEAHDAALSEMPELKEALYGTVPTKGVSA